MKLLFRTFNCGAGDCLSLTLKKGKDSFHIMVDCGCLKDEIQQYIENELGKRIDLLVVTHIDNDHIAGLATLLEKVPDLQIGKILFNCYHRPKADDSIELSDKQVEVLEELKRRLPSTFVKMDGKVSTKQAISLSKKILNNNNWAEAWRYEPVVAGMNINLEKEFGKIVILSPQQSDLEALENEFKKEFWRKFFSSHSNQYKNEEEIYEVLLRLWETTLVKEHTTKVSYAALTKETFVKAAEAKVMPVSLPNRCSIAFFYEYQDHRILLLGDSDPDIVAESLKKHVGNEIPFMMDLIKVSHHGSSHSTSNTILEVADSKHYYFSGGNREERPSIETLSRVITAPLHGQERRELHFNRKNRVINDLFAMLEIVEFPCIIDLDNKPYEVEI
ncbi:MAG: MBL fold metallo-hydrolase [Bacteroidales bacterium]|nr:MBL fold metallo-hydrolase [Bacteroidales bacterium]